MDVALYTGNGSTQTISGLNFSPDFLWIKSRSTAYSHRLYDTIRGTADALYSDLTSTEGANQSINENLTAFTSDGFSLGSTSGINAINNSNGTYVAWAWDAGSSTVTNTEGSITSQVRANASAGFSVVTYTGAGSGNATIGHGLGVAPRLIITKSRTGSNNWLTWHGTFGANEYIALNLTSVKNYGGTGNTTFGGTSASLPTSTVFTVGSDLNPSSAQFVAYCFAPVAGYSSFGSYTGNGSTDGPFVFTGFRPKFLLLKAVSAGDWVIMDVERDPYNIMDSALYPNDPSGDTSSNPRLDILSNGFKIRSTYSSTNPSNTVLYAAFAEHPLQSSRAR
jgi:hypothetical protein